VTNDSTETVVSETKESIDRSHSYEKTDKDISQMKFPFNALFKIGVPDTVNMLNADLYRLENGVVYMARGEKGHVAGYFDTERMILSENIIAKEDSLSSRGLKIFSATEENAVSVFDGSVFISSLPHGTFRSFEIGDKIVSAGGIFDNVLFRDGTSFIYENDTLILTSLMDLEEIYVLCPKNKLKDYGALMGLDTEEEKIYYAMRRDGGEKYSGFGYFLYSDGAGSSSKDKISQGETDIEFDTFTSVGRNGILLRNKTERYDIFTYLDTDSGKTRSAQLPVNTDVSGFTSDSKGNYLFVYTCQNTSNIGGEIQIYDLESSEKLTSIPLEEYPTNSGIIMDPTDTRLIFTRFSRDEDGVLGELVLYIDVRQLWK